MCSENFIRPVKFNNWFNHQIRSRFDQQFVYECVEIVQPVRVQEAMEVQWSMTKSQLGLEIPIIGLPTKCVLNLTNDFSVNTQSHGTNQRLLNRKNSVERF